MDHDVLTLMDEWGPEKVICISDAKSGMRGVLVLDNTARGMGKGGTRMSPNLTVREIARLARNMTWKWAVVDLYHGGAKAGILGDPQAPNKEEVVRAFARALAREVPSEYVFGLDMGLTEADAAYFVDELRDRGAAVGLPRELGGFPYDELGITGFGVAEATAAAANELQLDLSNARVAVQGFGAVGVAAALKLAESGASIVGVSTALGAVHDPAGLNLAQLVELHEAVGDECVRMYGGDFTSAEELLIRDTDILVSAAREDTIDERVASHMKTRLLVEGANMPSTYDAQQVLLVRGVTVVPDIIANAGGVVAAAHSMDRRYSPFRVDAAPVLSMVSEKLRENTMLVLSTSRTSGMSTHHAAISLAQKRVHEAMVLRGQRPRKVGVGA